MCWKIRVISEITEKNALNIAFSHGDVWMACHTSCLVPIVLLLLLIQRVERFIAAQLCPQASVAFTNAAITNAVETLGYSGLATKFRSQIIFCSTASCNPLV